MARADEPWQLGGEGPGGHFLRRGRHLQLARPGVVWREGVAWQMTKGEERSQWGLTPAHANMVSCNHCGWRGEWRGGSVGQTPSPASLPAPWLRSHHFFSPSEGRLEKDPLRGMRGYFLTSSIPGRPGCWPSLPAPFSGPRHPTPSFQDLGGLAFRTDSEATGSSPRKVRTLHRP